MGVGSDMASGAASGVEVATTCGDIVARACTVGVAPSGGTDAAGAGVGEGGDGTGPDEQAANAPAVTTKTTNDILRSDSTFLYL